MTIHTRQTHPFRWDGVAVSPYKPDGLHFAGITRQLLVEGGEGLACELRYFEIQPGGYSSLERHRHAHAVMVLRGKGRALVGDRILELALHDVVQVPSLTWHQFRADDIAPFGFLCMVDCGRDQPERPDPETLAVLRADPAIGAFVRG